MGIFNLQIAFLLIITTTSITAGAESTEPDLTAHRAAGPFEQLDLQSLPSWDERNYREIYREIRDKKFLTYDGEDRRIPWLFGRDGCHVRATHFIQEAQRSGHLEPKKIFVFGALEMRNPIIPSGVVDPWFHAAPIVQVSGQAVVLDPSVSFGRPLPLENWLALIVKDKDKVIYSICEPNTYLPTTSCNSPGEIDTAKLEKETATYLRFEKNILSYVGLKFKE